MQTLCPPLPPQVLAAFLGALLVLLVARVGMHVSLQLHCGGCRVTCFLWLLLPEGCLQGMSHAVSAQCWGSGSSSAEGPRTWCILQTDQGRDTGATLGHTGAIRGRSLLPLCWGVCRAADRHCIQVWQGHQMDMHKCPWRPMKKGGLQMDSLGARYSLWSPGIQPPVLQV